MFKVSRYAVILLASSTLLSGCISTSRPAPADIQPVYKIRNSPIPVPSPKWNPRRSKVANMPVPVRRQTVQRQSTRSSVNTVPSSSTITVNKGDTLYALSRRHDIPVRSLIAANNLRAPYALAVGQKLALPNAKTHTVRKGETGYGISRRYGVTASALMQVNDIKPPYRLSVGQKLRLPGGADNTSMTQTASSARNAPQKSRPATGRTIAMPTPPPRSSSGFVWPVTGKLASRFGPREGGLHNDGINILAKEGTPVKAAEAGVVVYASNALEGYGNLLLLKHSGGWITAYAHNERLLVRPGQKIQKGQVVARVGSTGGVTVSQLHFEIRKGRRALDPLRHLGSATSSR